MKNIIVRDHSPAYVLLGVQPPGNSIENYLNDMMFGIYFNEHIEGTGEEGTQKTEEH